MYGFRICIISICAIRKRLNEKKLKYVMHLKENRYKDVKIVTTV